MKKRKQQNFSKNLTTLKIIHLQFSLIYIEYQFSLKERNYISQIYKF